jgi:MoaA/NifB/PqqE/SkfB family radical SAM enzyme
MANIAYIQLIRKCNQRCRFCSNPPSGWPALTLRAAKKLIDKYITNKYDGVILTGGEPTLYSEIFEVIAYCRQKKIPCRLITNAQKTADKKFLDKLISAGLEQISVSIYSHIAKIQGFLSHNPRSLERITKTLHWLKNEHLAVNVIITINKYNAGHFSELVKFIVKDYPYIKHFIFNNLDPTTSRVKKHPDTIPKLNDFELELIKSLDFLEKNKRTFRVERVPLCYLPGFEYCSTETRKIVKNEIRPIYFLDEKGYRIQKDFFRKKSRKCQYCSLGEICAGLFGMNKYYYSTELYPVFIDQETVIKKIFSE